MEKNQSMLVEKGLRPARRQWLVEFHNKSVSSKNNARIHKREETLEGKMWRGKRESRTNTEEEQSANLDTGFQRIYSISIEKHSGASVMDFICENAAKKASDQTGLFSPLGKLSVTLKASEADVTYRNFQQCFLAF